MRDLQGKHEHNQVDLRFHQLPASTRRFQELMMKCFFLEAQVVAAVAEEKLVGQISHKCAVFKELQHSSSFLICIWQNLL